jgi:transketolase
MRTAFIEHLVELAAEDERIFLICGDLGYSVLEQFSDRFPDRYLNAGVAEQNMTGVAAGLALAGKTVFTYSIANFPVMRCLEQIRNDVCYHNLNVKVVSVGGGLAYGSHGYTHHGVEDLAVMSVMPNMQVIAPGDPIEAKAATRLLASTHGPAYLRLGKAGEPVLHSKPVDLASGKAIVVSEGTDATVITTGGMLGTAIDAVKTLSEQGISVRLLSMPILTPHDAESIRRAAAETRGIVTVEEHGVGGLGTIVAEELAISGAHTAFRPLRLGRAPVKVAGTQNQLREPQGLSVPGIIEAVRGVMASR